MIIKEISRNEYDEFLGRVESYSFLQTSEMAEVLKSNNRKIKLLALVEGEKILAVGLAFIRKIFGGERIDLMVGASAVDPSYEYIFYDKLRVYVKEEGFLKLVIKLDKDYRIYDQEGNLLDEKDTSYIEEMKKVGYMENDGSVTSDDGSPDFQFIKNMKDFIPDKDEDLLKSFNKNAQRKIKKAKELDIKVRAIKREELEDFKVLTEETAERQGFGDKSINYYQTFFDEFASRTEFLTSEIDLNHSIARLENLIGSMDQNSKGNKERIASLRKDLEMLEAFKKEAKRDVIPLANMILVYLEDEVIYFLGGSLTKYQKLPGAFILQYEAMRRICQREIPVYNFFGIDEGFEKSDGVLRFKQNFNGYVIQKAGAFIFYPDPEKYLELEKIKKKDEN
ncbi:peptidoglycan bridge formation glycyltransferase FemA/FemB family protein [uncultured Anaerococcus sp.]|uniref:peptidoglycan bridge formation glycyltransferase FemA/FemB family protein n=1 Tax=uncultured Anaerococcus sp. TaxID=293428 RepID=UPI00288BB187|nr:peptidoglycan bridge formation glycyltransferase FemA/FemB family protein [uncultured Anaerococcus sp.]